MPKTDFQRRHEKVNALKAGIVRRLKERETASPQRKAQLERKIYFSKRQLTKLGVTFR